MRIRIQNYHFHISYCKNFIMSARLVGSRLASALQLCPIWTCNNVQKCFATLSKKGLQKTEEEAQAVATCLKWYIARCFGKVSREFEQEVSEKVPESRKAKGNFYGKAAKRIPLWAKHPEQYCHKIIRGFF